MGHVYFRFKQLLYRIMLDLINYLSKTWHHDASLFSLKITFHLRKSCSYIKNNKTTHWGWMIPQHVGAYTQLVYTKSCIKIKPQFREASSAVTAKKTFYGIGSRVSKVETSRPILLRAFPEVTRHRPRRRRTWPTSPTATGPLNKIFYLVRNGYCIA